ncbi:MAG TPA: hypothetical protein VG938_19625 [Verrucomicrobiae bacterium]|jgi:hypothetical protein|nr:hypothetical protein [Verrucomicrobiae bacterium]
MAKFVSRLEQSFELANGGLIEVEIAVNNVRENFLKEKNLPVPTPIKIRGLIDTGATATCIDSRFMAQLSLQSQNYIHCHTAGGLRYPPVCPIKITLPLSDVPWTVDSHPCAAFNHLSEGGQDALIGLDILRHFHLVVDGPNAHLQLLLPEVRGEPPVSPPLDGHSFFDHPSDCFQRFQDGSWKQYFPPKKRVGLLSRLRDALRG